MSPKLRVHILQHVPYEDPAAIKQWINNRGHILSATHLYQNEALPQQNDFDWLIVMGGPMGVYDHEHYPWLQKEQCFILDTIESGKRVLGICLGSQLIAAVLGATVRKNPHREIGWFDIKRSQQSAETIFANNWPESMNVFHWHRDTFELPKGAKHLASSDACLNQGFILDNRVVGLQFHIEVTPDTVASFIENSDLEKDEENLGSSAYVQSAEELMADDTHFNEANQLLFTLLDNLENHT